MDYIDSHSHLYLEEFTEDLPIVIRNAQQAGISHILMPNIDSTTIADMLKVTDAYKEYCYPMMGLHPTSVNNTYKQELAIVEQHLKESNQFIAVGEVGLDLYWDKTYIKEQVEAFDYQIRLALNYNLPLVIHSREAFDLLYTTMLPYKETSLKGVFHSFTGTSHEALKLMEFTNFMLGINGVVTFKNSTLSTVLQTVPLDRIILETDAPYLTPVPYRGKRNESAYLKYTLLKLAGVYLKTPDEIANITSKNTLKVFERLAINSN
ncbi:TatD family hydrolase [Bacteroides sp. 519]|uniref:TatD family hydrolase n=1 Tax=Bacteroides sp. 519 TaxID=2302937 RepID=UPI0013D643DF|nr:TatD family hydrolase [Bacteroides sp. 519]NDV58689.1 TatD family deoxyribonuclease [Bacteroides sp. 519]